MVLPLPCQVLPLSSSSELGLSCFISNTGQNKPQGRGWQLVQRSPPHQMSQTRLWKARNRACHGQERSPGINCHGDLLGPGECLRQRRLAPFLATLGRLEPIFWDPKRANTGPRQAVKCERPQIGIAGDQTFHLHVGCHSERWVLLIGGFGTILGRFVSFLGCRRPM